MTTIFLGTSFLKFLKPQLSPFTRLLFQKSWFIISFAAIFILETISIFYLRLDFQFIDNQYARASVIIPQFIDMLQCTFELVHIFNGMGSLLYIDIIYNCFMIFYFLMMMIYIGILGCLSFGLFQELKTNFCGIDEEKERQV